MPFTGLAKFIAYLSVPILVSWVFHLAMSLDFQTIVQHLDAPQWEHTPQQIMDITNNLIQKQIELYDQIAKVETPTLDNVFKPYVDFAHTNGLTLYQLYFYNAVSPNKGVRDASSEAEKLFQKNEIDLSLREDVYHVFAKLWESVRNTDLNPETRRYLEKTMEEYRRNGLELPKDKREQLKEYQLQLSEFSVEFGKNSNENTEFILFTKEELEGVPEDVVEGFEKVEEDGAEKLKMTFKYPDVLPVLKYARNQGTRKRAFIGNQSKCLPNADILKKMVHIRFKMAKLLGYETFSEYVLEDRMAKNQTTVLEFLNDLRDKLAPIGKEEITRMKAFKDKDFEERGLPKQEEYYIWDHSYYNNLLLEKEYQVDHNKISEYFPLDPTIAKMLGFYEKLMDLKFYKVENPKSLWHEDVKQFAVFQNISQGNPEFMGFLHFDLHPREGKYGHAASFGSATSFITSKGSRKTPVDALVCNFTKPKKEKPSLLKHDEVTTFFHELGHGVHSLLAKVKYAKFDGTNVPRDFVEAPSQMLEFWTWTKNELKNLSSHYKTGEPISDDLIDQLIKSKHVNSGLANLRQLHFGLFDMKLHSVSTEEDLQALDLDDLWNDMREDISLVSNGGTKTPGYASFGHIAHGYESGYYGYLFSQVFASDMYYTLFKKDPMNVKNGIRYRDTILARGGSREMMDNLIELLGRAPNSNAFLEELLGN